MTDFKSIPWQNPKDSRLHRTLTYVKELLEGLEKSQWLSKQQIESQLQQQLNAVIKHSLLNVPFYRDRLSAFADKDFDINSFQDVPILSKDDVRQHQQSLISNKVDPSHPNMLKFSTSGSTGAPMSVYRGYSNILFTRAISLRYHLWHQRNFSLRNTNIITVSKKRASNADIYRAHHWASYVNTGPGFTIDISKPSKEIFDLLLELQPHYIQTHPSTLKRLIDISNERNQQIETLKEIRTFGELLEPQIVKSCTRHWDLPVHDYFSSEEMGPIAFQCPDNNHHHIQIENVYVEIVDEDGKACRTGQAGRILVTQLRNPEMPLIRYDIGDIGVLEENCSCGRHLPILKKIEGRVRNLVKLPSGDTFHPVFDEDILCSVVPISRYQCIQTSLDTIEINLVVKERLGKAQEAQLRKAFNQSFRHAFNYSFQYPDEIAFSQRNKFELFKCDI